MNDRTEAHGRVRQLLSAHPPQRIEPAADAGRIGRASWSGAGDNPLPVTLVDSDVGVSVSLDCWSHEVEGRDDDAWAEVADLLAGGLFGWIRLQVDLHPRGWTRCWIEVSTPGGWAASAPRRRRRWPPWGATTRRVLHNVVEAPSGLAMAASRVVLPSAPWAGLLVDEAANLPGELPLDGELDLHPFKPKDVAPLVREYISACRQRGVYNLRLVHGKGIGNLRRTVHALLEKHPEVQSYRLGGHGEGSWGATVVELKPLHGDAEGHGSG